MESNTEALGVFDVGSLHAEFCELHDSRKARGKRYRLETVLTLIVLAKVCGEDRASGIAEWTKHRPEWLSEVLKLERKTMPHRSSYERILEQVISWEELEQLVSRVLSGRRYFGKQVLVAIDGKVLRGTLNEKQEGVYLLAAYLPREGIVLMEVAIQGKGQELEAAPQVLKSIDLRDTVVMGDALHTQRAISIQIVESGGDYIWLAKDNQPQLEVQRQVVYGITSLTREQITPQALLHLIRSYWGIENGLHYRRDVTLHEDQTRTTRPNAARVMACLNNLVLDLLVAKKKFPYLPSARRFFAAHPAQALTLLTRL